jgi:hypothetical protein
VEGDPPHTASVNVAAPVGQAAQTTFTVQVFATGKSAPASYTTLTKHMPVITGFDTAEPTAEGGSVVAPTESIQLAWTSVYATQAWIDGPGISRQWYTNPSSADYLTRTPGLDLYDAASDKSKIPDVAKYTLTLSGYNPYSPGTGIVKSFSLDVQKVQLAYFKYLANDGGQLSQVGWATVPDAWPGVSMTAASAGKPNVLQIQQPGSRVDTYYLGTPDSVHPQIQYFGYASAGGGFTLSWITLNLTGLTLDGVAQQQIQSGSASVASAGTYTLVGTASNGESVASVLTIPAAAKLA